MNLNRKLLRERIEKENSKSDRRLLGLGQGLRSASFAPAFLMVPAAFFLGPEWMLFLFILFLIVYIAGLVVERHYLQRRLNSSYKIMLECVACMGEDNEVND